MHIHIKVKRQRKISNQCVLKREEEKNKNSTDHVCAQSSRGIERERDHCWCTVIQDDTWCKGSNLVVGPVVEMYSLSNKVICQVQAREDRRREEDKPKGLRWQGGPVDRNHMTKKGERKQEVFIFVRRTCTCSASGETVITKHSDLRCLHL